LAAAETRHAHRFSPHSLPDRLPKGQFDLPGHPTRRGARATVTLDLGSEALAKSEFSFWGSARDVNAIACLYFACY